MLLAIDIGNTNINLGCFADGALLFTSRVYSEQHRTADEYARRQEIASWDRIENDTIKFLNRIKKKTK